VPGTVHNLRQFAAGPACVIWFTTTYGVLERRWQSV
jgi:hypothetical protein